MLHFHCNPATLEESQKLAFATVSESWRVAESCIQLANMAEATTVPSPRDYNLGSVDELPELELSSPMFSPVQTPSPASSAPLPAAAGSKSSGGHDELKFQPFVPSPSSSNGARPTGRPTSEAAANPPPRAFVVVLTGATSGIGYELAKLFSLPSTLEMISAARAPSAPHFCLPIGTTVSNSAQSVRCVLVGRKRLSDIASSSSEELPPFFTRANYCQTDLSDAQAASADLLQFLDDQKIDHIDLLIHNAADGFYGTWFSQDVDSFNKVFDVNLASPILLTRTLLPRLLRVPASKVAFVSSVVSCLPTPRFAAYTATKAALDGFARSLRLELENQVNVQVLFPGATNSGFHKKLGIPLDHVDPSSFPGPRPIARTLLNSLIKSKEAATFSKWNDWALRGIGSSPLTAPLMRYVVTHSESQRVTHSSIDLERSEDHSHRIPHCVVTGASRGLGKSLWLQLRKRGYFATLLDSELPDNSDRLIDKGNDHFILTDFASSKTSSEAALQVAIPVDILVLSAWTSEGNSIKTAFRSFNTMTTDDIEDILNSNARWPILFMLELWKRNLLTARTRVVVVSALSHFTSCPGASVFAAAQDFISSFADSMRASYPVPNHVLAVYPNQATLISKSSSGNSIPEDQRHATLSELEFDDMAVSVIIGLDSKQKTVVPGSKNWLVSVASQFVPSAADSAMKRRIQEQRSGATQLPAA